MRGLTLPAVARLCGMTLSELVHIENGELLGFRQILNDALSSAQNYAKALDLELGGLARQPSEVATIIAKNNEVYIPAFLRKNN